VSLILRHNKWHLHKRVPRRYLEIEGRALFRVSLKTDSKEEAQRRASTVWDKQIAAWEAELSGDFRAAELAFSRVKEAARDLGIPYMQSSEVATLPIEDILARAEMAKQGGQIAEAALGAVKAPVILINDALELYWDLASDKVIGKSDDQVRRWRNPRIKAFKNVVTVMGNKAISEIATDDMLNFREWLLERVNRDEIKISSANKDLTHFCGTLRLVNQMKRLGINLPFDGIMIKGDDTGQRPMFSTGWIKDRILAPGALDGLDEQARDIVLMLINTGCRPSEVAGALGKHFHLDQDIPMLEIAPEGRTLKNKHSKRMVPLHGVSLEAAYRARERGGFPTYAGKDKVSDVINRYFRLNGLKETDGTTLYSLRHNFEDRMLEAGVADRVRRDIFGHSLQEQRYGDGGGDKMRYEAIKAVSL